MRKNEEKYIRKDLLINEEGNIIYKEYKIKQSSKLSFNIFSNMGNGTTQMSYDCLYENYDIYIDTNKEPLSLNNKNITTKNCTCSIHKENENLFSIKPVNCNTSFNILFVNKTTHKCSHIKIIVREKCILPIFIGVCGVLLCLTFIYLANKKNDNKTNAKYSKIENETSKYEIETSTSYEDGKYNIFPSDVINK